MIRLMPLLRLITIIAVSYAATIVFLYTLLSRGKAAGDAISWGWATGGGTILYWLLLGVFYAGWRAVWWCLPELNRWLFPDLNGKWDVAIHYLHDEVPGHLVASAQINQSLLEVAIHLESNGSESDTLAVVPKKDPQGRPYLHYLYRNEPKNVDGEVRPSYEGAATLKLDHEKLHCLSGNYFTAANTKGRFEFTRTPRSKGSIRLGRYTFVLSVIVLLGIVAVLLRAAS